MGSSNDTWLNRFKGRNVAFGGLLFWKGAPEARSLTVAGAVPRRRERCGGTMALTGLLVLELSLYCGCFCCGIVTAASITIVQVRPRIHPRTPLFIKFVYLQLLPDARNFFNFLFCFLFLQTRACCAYFKCRETSDVSVSLSCTLFNFVS